MISHLKIKGRLNERTKLMVYDVLNTENDNLGIIWFKNDLNEYIWEQNSGVVMALSCMTDIKKKLEELQ